MIYKPLIFIKKNKEKLLLILTIIFAYFSTREVQSGLNLTESISNLFYCNLYPIFLFFLLIYSSYIIVIEFDKNFSLLLRYNNKNNYIESIYKVLFINNFFICFLYNFFVIIFLLIKNFNNVNFLLNSNYNLLFIINNLFMFFKIFLIYNLLIKYSVLFYKYFSKTLCTIFIFSIIILKECWTYNLSPVINLGDIHLFLMYYLFPIKYSNIFLDFFSFIFIITILLLFLELFKYILISKKKISFEV